MSSKWEYKVAYVDRWQRTSVEGNEVHPEEDERSSAFARRFLNSMGADGWELTGIQHTMPGQSYMVFKRELTAGAEPDLSIVKGEPRGERHGRRHGQQEGQASETQTGDETVSL